MGKYLQGTSLLVPNISISMTVVSSQIALAGLIEIISMRVKPVKEHFTESDTMLFMGISVRVCSQELAIMQNKAV